MTSPQLPTPIPEIYYGSILGVLLSSFYIVPLDGFGGLIVSLIFAPFAVLFYTYVAIMIVDSDLFLFLLYLPFLLWAAMMVKIHIEDRRKGKQ